MSANKLVLLTFMLFLFSKSLLAQSDSSARKFSYNQTISVSFLGPSFYQTEVIKDYKRNSFLNQVKWNFSFDQGFGYAKLNTISYGSGDGYAFSDKFSIYFISVILEKNLSEKMNIHSGINYSFSRIKTDLHYLEMQDYIISIGLGYTIKK